MNLYWVDSVRTHTFIAYVLHWFNRKLELYWTCIELIQWHNDLLLSWLNIQLSSLECGHDPEQASSATHIFIYIYIHTYVYIFILIYTYIHTFTTLFMCIHMPIHSHVWCTGACTWLHLHCWRAMPTKNRHHWFHQLCHMVQQLWQYCHQSGQLR